MASASVKVLATAIIILLHVLELDGGYINSKNNNHYNGVPASASSKNSKSLSSSSNVATFTLEPPNVIIFLSSTGIVVPCHIKSMAADVPMKVSWQVLSSGDQNNNFIDVSNVPGLRLIRDDGSLVLLPFNESSNDYNPVIHSNTYRCIGSPSAAARSNNGFLIGTRRIKIRSVKECDWVPSDRREEDYNQINDGNSGWKATINNNQRISLSSSTPDVSRPPATVPFWFPKITTSEVGKVICVSSNGSAAINGHKSGHNDNGIVRYEMNLQQKFVNPLKVSLVASNPNPVIGEDIILNCTWNRGHGHSGHQSNDNGGQGHRSMSGTNNGHNNEMMGSIKMRHGSNYNGNRGNGDGSASYHGTSIGGGDKDIVVEEVFFYKNLKRINFDSHRIRKISESIIQIRSFRYNDNGIYQCFVATVAGSSDKDGSMDNPLFRQEWNHGDILLHLPESSPMMVSTFSEQIKIPLSDMSLKCTAIGSPLPSIKWKLDGMDIGTIAGNHGRFIVHESTNADASGTISTLNISSITSQDGGVYECEGINSVGRTFHKNRINVMGSVRVKPMTNVTTIAGQSYTLSCPFTGYPIHDVHFFKDGKKLPLDNNHGHLVQQQSMARIYFNLIGKDDTGTYTCVISSIGGEWSEGIINLKVLTAPVMSPFIFPDNLEEGMRASVICSVVAGDPPIILSWFKDGKPIDTSMADVSKPNSYLIQIVSITEFVSSLIINRLDRSFSGNYTCSATTDVGTVNHTSRMMVRSRPIWLLKPNNMAAVAGSGLRLDCLADGYPHPVIRWKMYKSASNGHGSIGDQRSLSGMISSNGHGPSTITNGIQSISILSSPRIHVLENGSLIIKSVTTDDAGRYVCEISNGIGGKSQESTADIVVHEKPMVRVVSSQITVKQSDRVELICRSEGTPPLAFDWFKDNNLIHLSGRNYETGSRTVLSNFGQYSIREESGSKDKVSILTINAASRNDSTMFTCLASNHYGTDSTDLRLVVQEVPGAPIAVRSIDVTSRSVTLSWSLDYNGNSPITGYEIVHKMAKENWIDGGKSMFISANSVPMSSSPSSMSASVKLEQVSSNSVLVPNLSPVTLYTFRIRSENDLGKSDFSNEVTVTTTIEAPQIMAENVTIQAMDSKSIKVSWTLSQSSELVFIEGFYIGYRVVSSLEPFTYKTMNIFHATNGHGPIVHPTMASDDGQSSLSLPHWTLPSEFSSKNLQNTLIQSSYLGSVEGKQSSRTFEYIVDSLRKGTKYSVIIQAFNSKGAGPSTNEMTIETFANDPPKAPSVRIEGITTSTATTSWRVIGDGTSTMVQSSIQESITGFILSYKLDSDDTYQTIRLPKQQRKYILTNLNCGNKYIVKVAAFNEVGNGEDSDDVHFSTDGRPPIAPDKYQFIRSNITSVSLNLMSWKDGGCPISSFVVQFKPKSQVEWILLSNHILLQQETLLIRDLNPSSWHDLLILAKNEAGTTEANYMFATLTRNGATIAPMLLSDGHGGRTSPLDTVMVIVPSMLIILVLSMVGFIVIYMIICKKRLLDGMENGDCHYGRGNGINDTLSLSSFSNKKNGSCSEPIYQQNQRVQVYYPASIYGDSTNGGRATLVRTSSATRNGQESSPIHCDYGFTPSMVPSTRVIRAKSSLNCHREDRHHLYDVPHRYLRKDGGQQQFLIQSATTTCNTPTSEDCHDVPGHTFSPMTIWTKSGSKELILDTGSPRDIDQQLFIQQ